MGSDNGYAALYRQKNRELLARKQRLYAGERREQIKTKIQQYRKENAGKPEARWNRLNRSGKEGSSITRQEFIKWASLEENKICKYCGTNVLGSGSGVDRIDSNRPYDIDNITSCCKHCNSAKNALTIEEFKAHIKKIYEYYVKDN